ncbi:carbohydrate kinase family protein [Streptomyces sp. NBC_00687]|uniref:carbohydrate kinase family protein n=1 Tax=Streptomyces sp. NBC_00687 TaxID=2975807 RepID=UPI00224F7124|nr:PfkB family carbohydrate kinase [Streptomyces sp. NBC_00687]MCX4919051.1 PfkB family carbohydrate kinase [Streptomyces sp. NBC_00687]
MTASPTMTVIALGAHILDTLVSPVERIPENQEGQLVDRIKTTAAGPAGGTALVLAKLGATTRSAGAIGTDALGDQLLALLARDGVDTSLLLRRSDAQTSASVVPVRPDGSHPTFHVVGTNGGYGPDDAPWEAIATATHLHLGAPELMGGAAAAKILSFAREHGVTTSVDCIVPGEPGWLDWIADCLPHVDHLLPNDDQVLGWTGADDLVTGCRALISRGVGCVAATAGAAGAVVVTADGEHTVPAFAADVVDTTGCGDSFSAGYLRGLSLGQEPAEAAVLGCATAAQVVAGLGTDHGDFDLAAVQAFAATAPTLWEG